jgi:hypothetical protein
MFVDMCFKMIDEVDVDKMTRITMIPFDCFGGEGIKNVGINSHHFRSYSPS